MLRTLGTDAVVAWYTAPGDVPMLRLARSGDAGDTFGAPVTIDQGPEVQGRVDVALDARTVWVLWVREEAGGQSLQLARYARDLSGEPERIEVAKIAGRGRATGSRLPRTRILPMKRMRWAVGSGRSARTRSLTPPGTWAARSRSTRPP